MPEGLDLAVRTMPARNKECTAAVKERVSSEREIALFAGLVAFSREKCPRWSTLYLARPTPCHGTLVK